MTSKIEQRVHCSIINACFIRATEIVDDIKYKWIHVYTWIQWISSEASIDEKEALSSLSDRNVKLYDFD